MQHILEPWLQNLQQCFRPTHREHESLGDFFQTLIREVANILHDLLFHRRHERLTAVATHTEPTSTRRHLIN